MKPLPTNSLLADAIGHLLWYIPALSVVFMLYYNYNKRIIAEKKIDAETERVRLKENSAGETALNQLRTDLQECKNQHTSHGEQLKYLSDNVRRLVDFHFKR